MLLLVWRNQGSSHHKNRNSSVEESVEMMLKMRRRSGRGDECRADADTGPIQSDPIRNLPLSLSPSLSHNINQPSNASISLPLVLIISQTIVSIKVCTPSLPCLLLTSSQHKKPRSASIDVVSVPINSGEKHQRYLQCAMIIQTPLCLETAMLEFVRRRSSYRGMWSGIEAY